MPEHVRYRCPPRCETRHCRYCDGGLFECTVCGGAEGALPEECPGRRLTSDEMDEIYGGRLDFRNGRWWVSHGTTKETPDA